MKVKVDLIGKVNKANQIYASWYGFPVGYRIASDDDEMSIPVNDMVLQEMGWSMDGLIARAAMDTREPKIIGMMEILTGIPNPDDEMFVITSETGIRGASALVRHDAYEIIRRCIPKGTVALIPSSIHEWIAYRIDEMIPPTEIVRIINEVNTEEVDLEDQLGDTPLIVTDRIMTLAEFLK